MFRLAVVLHHPLIHFMLKLDFLSNLRSQIKPITIVKGKNNYVFTCKSHPSINSL